jgi:calcineurin-like phosphoesterase family protein
MINAFYSDPHFGHSNVIKYSNRPFKTVQEMDDRLIQNYNDVVRYDDIVLWLGDCFFGPVNYMRSILCKLNGDKILVIGGHDGSKSRMLRAGFSAVMDQCYIMIDGHVCMVSHYPKAGTRHAKGSVEDSEHCSQVPKNVILIHGHTHAKERVHGNQIHVGVDAWGFYPVTVFEIERCVQKIYQG